MDTRTVVYRYPFASHLETNDVATWLRFAAFSPRRVETERGPLFDGRVVRPEAFGRALLALSSVVAWNELAGYVPTLLRDPVVTANDDVLRFEGFSATCSMHVRLDLKEDVFDGARIGRGTTNVDFNEPLVTALVRLRDRHATHLRVTPDRVSVKIADTEVVERKVDLPTKWVRGFCELPMQQRTLLPRIEVDARAGLAFVRSLPNKPPRRPWYVLAKGGTLQSTVKESADAAPLGAASRLRLLEPLLRPDARLRVWSNEDRTTLWEVKDGPMRFSLLLAADPYRGFSAGGSFLDELAAPDLDALSRVRAALAGQAELEPAMLARTTGAAVPDVMNALAVLGGQGLLGFDHDRMMYFHRELPFALDAIDHVHPRVAGAQRLLDEGRVRRTAGDDFEVRSKDVVHYVRLRPDGDKCSCTWFSTHGLRLGRCKHVLAARQAKKVGTS